MPQNKIGELRCDTFKRGDCDAMAIALHRRYGYPMGVARGYFEENDDLFDEELYSQDCHAFVIVDKDKELIMDVEGVRDFEEVKSDCVFLHGEPLRIDIYEVGGEEDMKFFFTIEGVKEESIGYASDCIDKLKIGIPEH